MNSQTKKFDFLFGTRWLTVTYDLYPGGRKLLMSIEYDSLPIDVVELRTSNQLDNRLLYHQICDAMDNNAISVMEEKKETA